MKFREYQLRTPFRTDSVTTIKQMIKCGRKLDSQAIARQDFRIVKPRVAEN